MAELKVLLDPGHGSGSSHNRGFLSPGNEGESNYYMAIALERELKAYGITVGRTRKTIHENPTLAQRGAMAKGYDLLLSLHSNAGASNVRGVEIFPDTNPWKSVGQSGYDLAWKLSRAISALGTPNRGVRTWNNDNVYKTNVTSPPYQSNYFGVLRASEAPMGMLIEFAYHTNQQDRDFIVNKRDDLAKEVARVVAEHYGVKKTKPIERTTLTTPAFINMIRDDIIADYYKSGVLPSISLAQAILESDSGNSVLAVHANSIFGIKASAPWTGAVYDKVSVEYINGAKKEVKSSFRKYKDWKESITDHGEFFTSTPTREKLYAPVLAAKDYKEATKALTGTYATDPNYKKKLDDIIERNKLYLFDEQVKKKEKEEEDKKIYLNKAFTKEELLKMQPRFGVFTLQASHQKYVNQIIKEVSGAVQFDYGMTPTELFQRIIYVGNENIYPYYTFIKVGVGKEEDESTVNAFIADNRKIKDWENEFIPVPFNAKG